MTTNNEEFNSAMAVMSAIHMAMADTDGYRGILNDDQITLLAADGMIDPFVFECVRVVNDKKIISYGLQSFGYDLRIGNQFRVFRMPLDHSGIVDPMAFNAGLLQPFEGDVCIIPPNSFALAASVEYFRMPRNVTGVVLGKSTYARCGIVANFTPLEAGWEGNVTIEISNTSSLPAKVYANMGFAQVLFFAGDPPKVSYADRAGKYQAQTGITLARV